MVGSIVEVCLFVPSLGEYVDMMGHLMNDDIKGRLVNGSRSSDGHYVVRGEVEQIPKWMRSDCGYALPEYEPKTIECSRCGVVHRKHSRPCECIFRMPALILSDVCVVGLRIYKRRCDDYINAERKRLLDWMFAPVMPTIPLFLPGLKNARATEISKEGTNTEQQDNFSYLPVFGFLPFERLSQRVCLLYYRLPVL